MGMQMVSACVYPHASLQCRCVASLWERARTTPERRDMGLTLESETGPRQGPYCIGVGRAPGRLSSCYVMLCLQASCACRPMCKVQGMDGPRSSFSRWHRATRRAQ